jgi:hypothetical protein
MQQPPHVNREIDKAQVCVLEPSSGEMQQRSAKLIDGQEGLARSMDRQSNTIPSVAGARDANVQPAYHGEDQQRPQRQQQQQQQKLMFQPSNTRSVVGREGDDRSCQPVLTLRASQVVSGNCEVPIDTAHCSTWVYPTNMPVRDYQMTIVEAALFDNALVCLPTGLGKTFIAAVVMYNFRRCSSSVSAIVLKPAGCCNDV